MLLLTHAGLMMTGFLVMATAMLIARYARTRKWWFKAHRVLTLTGFVVMILGLFAEALQLSLDKNEHFAVPHAYLGLVVFILALATIILGQMQLGIPQIRARLRKLHIWFGRGTLFLMVANIAVGLSLVGLI
jgi:steroid 5-alpha reductase family enzyme